MSLRKEGYVPELDDPAPSIIPFTTTIASLAVSELLHRITSCLGEDRASNEVLILFHNTRLRTNFMVSKEECFCGDPTYISRGDSTPFLDLTWRPE